MINTIARMRKIIPLLVSLITVMGITFATDTAYSTNTPQLEATTTQTSGPKLSFYFQNIDIRSLLQLVAKSSGMNFVISDSVKGNITLSLKDVTWQQALAIVMEAHGLSSRTTGNVVYIGTTEEIASNQSRELQAEEQIANLAPLTSAIIQLKYSNATDMAAVLKGQQSTLLTSRGQVAVDTHTNSIIIRDTAQSVIDVKNAIKKLDIPAKQVLIEARIVSVDITYEKQLGVRFGVSDSRHLSGTLNGANQIAGGVSPSQVTLNSLVDPTERLNFNNAAAAINDINPGTVGLALAHVGHFLLDLELSALEEEGNVTIISRPSVIASNQQKATIKTGTEIPYQESTSSGATSISFKDAVLSLEITPQITPDNKIVLNIKANQDSPGAQIPITAATSTSPAQLGPPAIDTQSVESNVLLNDNETIVLGGIYKVSKSDILNRVPFLGTLPVVGALFRNDAVDNETTELLVFITPKIIRSNHNPNPTTKAEDKYAKLQ